MNEKIIINGERITRIPDGIQVINVDTLDWKFEIEELFIPDSVEKVEPGALEGCNNLRKLTMPARFLKPYNGLDSWTLNREGFDTSASFLLFFKSSPSKLEEVVAYGDEVEMDLSIINWEHFMRYSPKSKRTLRIENELISVKLPENVSKEYCPKIFINNYVENMEFSAPTRWTLDKFYFRAPKPNTRELEANAIELTLAPRETYPPYEERWCCPITVNCSAVSYITPVEISCYEENKHQGCELLLLGERLDVEALANLRLGDFPKVVVWEDKETAYQKLLAKGW